MNRKHILRPKTIIVLLKVLGLVLLLFFPVRALATEFNIQIDPALKQNTAFDATAILESVTAAVNQDFQYTNTKPVEVIVYSRIKFAEALGNSPTWTEAAYDGKIHIAIATDQKDFRIVTSHIVHEYTHLIVADLTQNNCPRWFNEGLARYEEYRHGIPPRLYLLAIAYNSDVLIPWHAINSQITSKNSTESLLAYQQAFCFVYYLVETYGMPKIVALLKTLGTKVEFDAAIQQTYGASLTTLQTNWQAWLGPFITNWAEAPVIVQ